jgi:hypothetical protein
MLKKIWCGLTRYLIDSPEMAWQMWGFIQGELHQKGYQLRKEEPTQTESHQDSPVEVQLTSQLKCPECGGTKFQLGPRGGAARNIRCECGHELNITSLPDGRFLVEDITKRA